MSISLLATRARPDKKGSVHLMVFSVLGMMTCSLPVVRKRVTELPQQHTHMALTVLPVST